MRAARRTARRLCVGVVAALLPALLPTVALARGAAAAEEPPQPPPMATWREAPCPVPVPVPDTAGRTVRCGWAQVPAHHADPAGATVEVAAAVIPARRPVGQPPLVMLAGGPGEKLVRPALLGSIVALANDVPAGLTFLAQDRDLVLLEQRGAGASRPALECPEVANAWSRTGASAGAGLVDAVVAGYAACRARLVADGIDLAAFNTAEAARDVPAAVAALGYASFDLFGTSYGARLALQVARLPDSGLRRLVLASAIPAEADFVRDVGASYDAALHELGAACAEDPECARRVPDLVTALDGVLRRLEREPAPVVTIDPQTGRVVATTLDAFGFDSAVYGLFYSPGGPALVPTLVARAAAGDLSGFSVAVSEAGSAAAAGAPAGQGFGAQESVSISLGQQVTFLCAEEHARPDEPLPAGTVRSYAAALFVAVHPVLGHNLDRVCQVWDVPPAPGLVFDPVRFEGPTLVVSGRFDQITPPAYGRAIAASLPASVSVVVPSAGHSPIVGAGRCGLGVVIDFVSRAEPATVDTGCLDAPLTFRLDAVDAPV
ncbi:MAG: alpha/beta fold hydrolase [Acidimicrobiia bacterium]